MPRANPVKDTEPQWRKDTRSAISTLQAMLRIDHRHMEPAALRETADSILCAAQRFLEEVERGINAHTRNEIRATETGEECDGESSAPDLS